MPAPKLAARARPQEVDRYVGARIRERRIILGLTQQQMADLIGVTYQQAHKYENAFWNPACRSHSVLERL